MSSQATPRAPVGPVRSPAPEPPSPATRGPDARSAAIVAMASALATLLCSIGLVARSLGFDEGATAAIVGQHGAALRSAIAHDGGNMSGYYAFMHVLVGWFGHSTFMLRLPSALATGITSALVSVLAQRLFGHRAAVAAGLLSAVSLPLVFWGQSARGYAPMVALVTASFLVFVMLVDGEERSGRVDRRAWLGYVVFTTLAVYAGFVAVLVIPAQLILWVSRRRRFAPVALALAVSALCCVPLLVLALSRGAGQLFWVPRPNGGLEKQVLEALTSSGLQPSFRATSTTVVLLALTILLLIGVAVQIIAGWSRSGGDRPEWGRALVLAWLIVPVGLAWLESWVRQPIFLPRNLLVSLPAVALLLSSGFADRRLPRFLAWTLLGIVLALRTLQLIPSYGVSPEDWHGATRYVLAHTRSRDCIAFYPADGRMAFGYYVGTDAARTARAPRPVLPTAPWTQVRTYVERYQGLPASRLRQLPSDCARMWLVSSHEGQLDGPPAARANRARYLLLRAGLQARYARRRSATFGYASPVNVELLSGKRLG